MLCTVAKIDESFSAKHFAEKFTIKGIVNQCSPHYLTHLTHCVLYYIYVCILTTTM